MFLEKELKDLENKKNKLEKKDIDLIISDFDDTLFSISEFLKINYCEGRRGDEGNKFLLENNLIKKVIKECYINKEYPKAIVSKLRLNHDLILTAGIVEYSGEKLKATGLDRFNYIITKNGETKIFETINYVVNTLGFIPSKITVYEDRPKYFIEHKELIENFLGTKLEIMFVEMKNNYEEPKITKL